MGKNSKIEWTMDTWNPLTGCNKISAGCKNCYAERFAKRMKAMGIKRYENGFKLTLHDDLLERPLKWRKSRLIFVNSMSDLFHKDVPLEFIRSVFDTMNAAYWHTFQVLTKRAERLAELSPYLNWTPNVWMGVSVENSNYLYRIDLLKQTGAHIKFISFEPLLGPVDDADLTGIDWVIVGGESGPGARPMKKEWVTVIRDKCVALDIPFFFKQWGGRRKERTLEGKIWDAMPSINDKVAVQ